MSYVVTQACCADASCVVACPVNCIHPTPGEPGFAEAEMLYVDPAGCVDCGACATACPVDAILPHTDLTAAQQPFRALNTAYFESFPHADRRPMAAVPRQRRLTRPGRYRIAVVGAGPAGLFVADELLRHPEVGVDVLDRLPTPGGLVRSGVAPDHASTRQVTRLFAAIEQQPGFDYRLGVEVGRDVTHQELAARYHAVVYAVGASAARPLGIEGEDLRGSLAATDLVGWYNGHPDRSDLEVPLDHRRAVVVGNGNVALDVARLLARPASAYERTDIAARPWAALARSRVEEVVVLGRRGPADAAFTLPELIGLAGLEDLDLRLECADDLPGGDKGAVLRELASRPGRSGVRRVVLRFRTAPARILGVGRVCGVETSDGEVIDSGLVVRANGFRAEPVPGLPFDHRSGTVPHARGRVAPGTYVAGWIKRGATGFIGTNRSCARETVEAMLDDLDAGALTEPGDAGEDLTTLLTGRGVAVVDLAGWRTIDQEERRRGQQQGRLRDTIDDHAELRRLALGAGSRRRRYAAGHAP